MKRKLLIALAILSIISAGIYYTLNAGIGENQRIGIFFDMVSKDMLNVVPFSGIPSKWTKDSVSFHVLSATEPHKKLIRRIYYFDAQKGELKRGRVIQKGDSEEKYVDEKVLLDNLEGISFEYAYKRKSEQKYEWRDVWNFENKDIIPKGIKIKVRRKSGNTEKTFMKIVFIPTGELGKQ